MLAASIPQRPCLRWPSPVGLCRAGKRADADADGMERHAKFVGQVERWCRWFDETVIGGEGIVILLQVATTAEKAEVSLTSAADC